MYPSDDDMRASIDAAFDQLKGDFQKPLKRQDAGGNTFTIWRLELEVTTKKPFVLTKVAKRKVCNKLCVAHGTGALAATWVHVVSV